MSLPGANPKKKNVASSRKFQKNAILLGGRSCGRNLHSRFGIPFFLFFLEQVNSKKMQLLRVLRQKFAFSFWNIVWSAVHTAVHNVMDIFPSSNPNQEMDVVADHEQVPIQHETPNKWMRLYGMNKWPPTMPTGRIRPDWRDWLMAPLIMSSINESWIVAQRAWASENTTENS